jgi:SRSO17 transposase
MEARYAFRKSQLLDECQIAPEIFEQVIPRLYSFMKPFVKTFQGQAADQHAKTYVCGLLSDVERKNVESIAYHFGQDRLGLQRFIGWAEWDDAPLRQVLIEQVGKQLGQADGVLVFDPSAFAKSGPESVGVARQWCGRLGKVDNCQVALYLGYVSRKGHTLVNMRLYLPKAWTQDKARLNKAGVPTAHRGYRTRHQLALAMLEQDGASLPHRWIAGDDEMGRPYWFRRRLAALGERYVLAVPSNTWWCPSIAYMKGRQRDAGRLLIESVDESQMALGNRQGVEQTGGYGTTVPARSRSTSTFWLVPRRELPSAKARLAMV